MITTGEEGFTNGGGDGSYVYTTGESMDFEANPKIPICPLSSFHNPVYH
jgi:mannan endo-1,4-beta-mannosidase